MSFRITCLADFLGAQLWSCNVRCERFDKQILPIGRSLPLFCALIELLECTKAAIGGVNTHPLSRLKDGRIASGLEIEIQIDALSSAVHRNSDFHYDSTVL